MRGILKKILTVIAALTAATFVIALDVWFEVRIPKAETVNILSAKITEGNSLKFVQISDVHGSRITDHHSLVEKISEFSPAAIFMTGDLVDRSTVDFTGVYEDVSELIKIAPVIFITGNHDLANPEGEKLIKGLRKEGVIVLRNSSTVIRESDTTSVIAGIEDAHFGGGDIDKAVKGIDDSTFNILLSHTPAVATQVERPLDLVLSGHTHGGQVRLPFFGAIFLPDKEILPALIKGLSETEKGVMVYTDSGFGTSVIPVRFMDRSQISLITINGTGKKN